MGKYYAVWSGRRIGIYDTWVECEKQVKGYDGARFKSFPTKKDAYEAFTGRAATTMVVSPNDRPEGEYICVDAAFSSSTNIAEYRGLVPETGEELFHYKYLPDATNNVAEFFAIVHALSYCKLKDTHVPIYTDSQTAMAWVRSKRVNTSLARTDRNGKVFELIERAEAWLRNNAYANPIIKWETKNWGEIPADFGRK
jgi:ribonuclease HI